MLVAYSGLLGHFDLPDSKHDISPEHFAWLVNRRSENQTATLRLYAILHRQQRLINRDPQFFNMAQILTGVAFSLWRAVFLSDVTNDVEKHFEDLNKFIISLIADNSVLYQTDKNAKNWSFGYYLDNAEYRLKAVADKYPALLASRHVDLPATSEKERWQNAQKALDIAIAGFETTVDTGR